MTEGMHDISRAIGRLDATVENLTRTWQEQDKKATEGRKQLYNRFEELKDQVIGMAGRVDKLAEDIMQLKPSVRLFEDGQQRSAGARTLARILWAIVAAVSTSIGWLFHELFGGHPPPHS